MDIYLGVTQGFRSQLCQSFALQLLQATEFSSGNICSVSVMTLVFRHSACVGAKSLQSCPTLCDPMGCSPPGFSVHGILQARILESVAISSSRDLPNPGMEPGSPTLQADSLLSEPPGKPRNYIRSLVTFSLILTTI